MRDSLIHMLSIKGFAKAEILAEASGASLEDTQQALDALASEDLISETRMGAKLSETGAQAAARLLEEQQAAGDGDALERFYHAFEPINAEYKAALADWQMRPGADGLVPNDHSDADYDAQVKERMFASRQTLLNELQALEATWPSLTEYADRLSRAYAKVSEGNQRYLAAPLIDSYHTVWFELHEALIRASGRNRADEAAAGRAV